MWTIPETLRRKQHDRSEELAQLSLPTVARGGAAATQKTPFWEVKSRFRSDRRFRKLLRRHSLKRQQIISGVPRNRVRDLSGPVGPAILNPRGAGRHIRATPTFEVLDRAQFRHIRPHRRVTYQCPPVLESAAWNLRRAAEEKTHAAPVRKNGAGISHSPP